MANSPAIPMSTNSTLQKARTRSELDSFLQDWRKAGQTIAFVPTMGALHDGHLSLIELAHKRGDKVVSSIFVNPKQFGPNEDYVLYPRNETGDVAKLESMGAHLAYLPTPDVLYPPGNNTDRKAGSAAEGLESDARPGFFDGVVSAVGQLFDHVKPDVAIFGEKDYQQLCVVKEAFPGVKIEGAPTVRDEHGLALSSRNAYLSDAELQIARKLNKVLFLLADEIRDFPQEAYDLIPAGIQSLLDAGFDSVDYLELREENTLAPMERWNQKPARLLVAARLGKTRLIDNVRV